ncbi:hypothetical protein SAMN05445756_1958 [Kytococcus aerolatus]|uniref:Uncharacterized protein n=1 Tax=Kytococcus aerolatus TaxID=592308 RepID=A0A212U5S0_9MICO|nr:hypothetical protein [Kytococcus aerolatus]SNC73424.1 hypothetical protein SAMN05445756_1958 [Kytococcus aerolatus]
MRTALRRALPALVLGWAGTSSALPDFVRTRRRRWPLQVALAGVAGALVAAAVSGPPEDGTEEDPQPDPALEAATPGGSGTEAASRVDFVEQELPATAQGMDQPEGLDTRMLLLAGAAVLGLHVAGNLLWFKTARWLRGKGVTHPHTALTAAVLPVAAVELWSDLNTPAH